jgi:hypothetical protein
MLEVKQINSRATLEFFSIRLYKEGAFSGSVSNFRLIDMLELNA